MYRYRIQKTYQDLQNNRQARVEFYLPVPEEINAFGATHQAAFLRDPRFADSRLAVAVALQHGEIWPEEEGETLCVVEDLPIADVPDVPELRIRCRKRLRALASLLNRDLQQCYEFTGLTEAVEVDP